MSIFYNNVTVKVCIIILSVEKGFVYYTIYNTRSLLNIIDIFNAGKLLIYLCLYHHKLKNQICQSKKWKDLKSIFFRSILPVDMAFSE